MRLAMRRVLAALCLVLALTVTVTAARGGTLEAIPSDTLAFAVVHDLADASHAVGDLAKLVQAPAPDLLAMAKGMTGLQKGLDEQGDLAVVLTTIAPAPKGVILLPVANAADFFASLGVKEPAGDVVEVRLAGKPSLVGSRGHYAVFAPASDREALQQYLAASTSLADDKSLAAWIDANQMSAVLTTHGIQQLVPRLIDGIHAIQAQMRKVQGEQGQFAADALNIYVDLFTAAQREVDQFGVGVRIDSTRTVELVKRAWFKPDGVWAKWAAGVKPAEGNLLAGIPADPFMMAGGCVIPQGLIEGMMKFSTQMMQQMYHFTPEQAQHYLELSKGMMQGVHSMAMLIGALEPGAGFYGNTSIVMKVDDSRRFIDQYEKSLATLSEFAKQVKNPVIPVATSHRIKVDDVEGLEVSVDMSKMPQLNAPGNVEAQKKMMKLFTGPGGVLKIYLAPADEHTVVMAYTSLDHLKSAIDFYKSGKSGLADEAGVVKTAAKLPAGAQAVGYVSLGGMMQFVRQYIAAMAPQAHPEAIPQLPDCPPIGVAAKVTADCVEGYLVITADTLKAIGETVAKARGDHTAPAADRPE